MRWPWSSDDDSHRKPPPILSIEYWSDPKNYLHPRVLIPATILTVSSLGLIHVYRSYIRRIPESSQIYPSFFRKRSLFGQVTSVGDADNFRLYHTPGGRLLGWGWLPGRKVPTDPKELRQHTVHIRIAGIDAPELGHWGNPAQPYAAESLEWLRSYLLGSRVRAFIYRRDQYDRIVGSVKVWKGLWRRDLGLEMLKAGVAAVYESKIGAEFGNMEEKYRMAETKARMQKKGMWGLKGRYESPRTYKKALKDQTETVATGGAVSGSTATAATTRASTSKLSTPGASHTASPGGKGGIVIVGKEKHGSSGLSRGTIVPTTAVARKKKPLGR